jgi:hypothetical protein
MWHAVYILEDRSDQKKQRDYVQYRRSGLIKMRRLIAIDIVQLNTAKTVHSIKSSRVVKFEASLKPAGLA